MIFFRNKTIHDVYIVAESSTARISSEIGRKMAVLGTISGSNLAGPSSSKQLYYKSAMANVLALPMVASSHVNEQTGSGLVHVSYAHGHEDYEVIKEYC